MFRFLFWINESDSNDFRKKRSIEERKAPNENRILRGRQIAYMIYEFCRATVSPILWELRFRKRTSKDSIRNRTKFFWYFWKNIQQESQRFRTIAVYFQDTVRKREEPSYTRLKDTMVRRFLDHEIKDGTSMRGEMTEQLKELQ